MKKQKEEKSKVKIPVKTKPKVKALADNSAEQKIKEAAKRLFTQKGYSATKTRDIAAEAGINLALLNYYFRSKEKLFDIIMMENLQQFAMGILTIMMDNEKKLDEKIEILVDNYIDMLSANPDLPFFVLNEMRKSTPHLPINIETVIGPIRAQFMEKLRKEGNEGKEINVNPFHIIANLMGMIVFPFVGAPILQKIGNIDREQFNALMQERKKLIPIWIKAIIQAG